MLAFLSGDFVWRRGVPLRGVGPLSGDFVWRRGVPFRGVGPLSGDFVRRGVPLRGVGPLPAAAVLAGEVGGGIHTRRKLRKLQTWRCNSSNKR